MQHFAPVEYSHQALQPLHSPSWILKLQNNRETEVNRLHSSGQILSLDIR